MDFALFCFFLYFVLNIFMIAIHQLPKTSVSFMPNVSITPVNISTVVFYPCIFSTKGPVQVSAFRMISSMTGMAMLLNAITN